MPWRGEEYPGEFPTLGYEVGQFIQDGCVVPDREMAGEPFILTDEQLRFLLFHYRLDPETGRFFHERGSQLIRPQKWGKGPLLAAIVCAEASGPVLFDGWDAQGEPVGRPWATPHIQVTACSEDQTDNTWRALQPMIELGPLGADMITDTGLTRINLPGGGLIEPVTASARSRLGQRISFAVEDETQSWVQGNNGWWLADNQRRNLAGVGGRFVETTNAFDPAEQSVAQRTFESPDQHVFKDYADPPAGSFRNKAERRKIMRFVYGDSLIEKGGWVDLDRIDVEVEALNEHDPAQSERFFGNRLIATEGSAFDIVKFRENKVAKMSVVRHELIVIGVDGARFDDAIAAVATHVKSGYQWPLVIIERPKDAPDDYEHPVALLDEAVREAFDLWSVWRAYCDPHHIEHIVEGWQNQWGDKTVIPWFTYRPRQIAWAVRNYEQAIFNGDMSHSGDELFERHIAQARKRKLSILDDHERQMHTLSKDSIKSPRKIDAAMAAVLSWEARGDAIAAGAVSMTAGNMPMPPGNRDPKFRPGFATPASLLHREPEYGPMGSLS